MLKLERETPVFETGWFLSAAMVLAFLLGTLFMAATDHTPSYQMQRLTDAEVGSSTVVVVRAPRLTPSGPVLRSAPSE